MKFVFPLLAKPVCLAPHGEIDCTPSVTSTASDYDFLQGYHLIKHQILKERLNGCSSWIEVEGKKSTEKILGGVGNIEHHSLTNIEGRSVQAVAIRLFDQTSHLWSLYWADNIAGKLDPPLRGSFDGDLGVFFGKDVCNGREVIVQFQYNRSNPEAPVWGQAFSADNGATWEWNWFMFYRKK